MDSLALSAELPKISVTSNEAQWPHLKNAKGMDRSAASTGKLLAGASDRLPMNFAWNLCLTVSGLHKLLVHDVIQQVIILLCSHSSWRNIRHSPHLPSKSDYLGPQANWIHDVVWLLT